MYTIVEIQKIQFLDAKYQVFNSIIGQNTSGSVYCTLNRTDIIYGNYPSIQVVGVSQDSYQIKP